MRPPQSILRHLHLCSIQTPTSCLAILLVGLFPGIASASSPQLICSPTSLQFGAVDVGQAETLTATVTNGGSTSLSITQITSNNAAFNTSPVSLPLALLPGQSFQLTITYTANIKGITGGAIKFLSNPSNATVLLPISGGGITTEALSITPSSVSFGPQAVGSVTSVPLVLQNAHSSTITVLGVRQAGSGFSVSGATFPLTVNPGQSVTMNAVFNPQSAGASGGSLFLLGTSLVVPLTGTGTTAGQLSIAPAPLNFGNVAVGSTGSETLILSAAGSSVTVSSIASNNSQFGLEGGSLPFTIPAGQSVSLNVGFTPKNSGSLSAALTIGSNASDSSAVETMDGTGTVTPYTVNLWWNPSSDVVGYNVYRSLTPSGTYAKINPSLDPTTTYSDSSVLSGATYYYSATSVNSVGQESGRSTPPVVATIP